MVEDPNKWAVGEAEAVSEGVFRLPLPIPGDICPAVNVYAIQSSNGVTLVDGGWAMIEAENELTRLLRSTGAELGDVRTVLVTHAHRDHYPLTMQLRRKHGVTVGLGSQEEPNLRSLQTLDQVSAFGPTHVERLRRAGAADLAETMWEKCRGAARPADWEDPDVWLADNATVPVGEGSLRVIATPGHTKGHVAYQDEERGLLFAGDLVLTDRRTTIGYERNPPVSPIATHINSLRHVRSMAPMALLPGHGPAITGSAARIDTVIAELEGYVRAQESRVIATPRNAVAVAERAAMDGLGKSLFHMTIEEAVAAVLDTLNALQLLEDMGSIRGEDDEFGVRFFTRVLSA